MSFNIHCIHQTATSFTLGTVTLAVCVACISDSHAQGTLAPVVVTAPVTAAPLTLHTDPKAARQPLPAQDGADFLARIPGFSQIRKGAASGDPVFRGLSGSRLGIVQDGQEIYGGCPMRMDPPTAYIHPESFDHVTLIKGPQSVLHGAGQSAGTVHFERLYQRPEHFTLQGSASATAAQTARHDQTLDVTIAHPQYYLRTTALHARAGHYKDGDGQPVHSRYERWNAHTALGWTPDATTRLEFSAGVGDGKAAAADSPMMDGSRYRRNSAALLLEKKQPTEGLAQLQARFFSTTVDHVMDNYSLRPAPPGRYMASNPDRHLHGARVTATIALPSNPWQLDIGAERQSNQHRGRASGPQASAQAARAAYHARMRSHNLRFEQTGLFGELRWQLPANRQMVSGVRIDRHQVLDQRSNAATRGASDRRILKSGFARYEQHFEQTGHSGYWYAGLGHSQRFPDFWERMKTDASGVDSAVVTVRPEKLTQLDIGVQYEGAHYDLNVSAFYGHISDYVLLYWPEGGAQANTLNVDTRIRGVEMQAQYRFNAHWSMQGSISHVWGENRTQHQPLAQQPPLQAQWGLDYAQEQWSAGIVWRGARGQKRWHQHHGGIASKDKGATPGFGILALHATWRAALGLSLSMGVDNLLDRTYAEHLSKTGGGPAGIWPRDQRIHEAGRTAWVKAQWVF